jgi:hypothetical protein
MPDERGVTVIARGGGLKGVYLRTTNKPCFEGCEGKRVSVRWPDGSITYPCTAGMDMSDEREWLIT